MYAQHVEHLKYKISLNSDTVKVMSIIILCNYLIMNDIGLSVELMNKIENSLSPTSKN